jgi:hypothetical protein
MQVLNAYRSLSAEQKQILGQKHASLNRRPDELIALLGPLAACDTLSDKARTKFGCTFALGIVLTIAVPIAFSSAGWHWSAWIVWAVVAAVMLGAGWLYFWTRSIDVSNNLRQFFLPVLAIFREDIDAAHPMHLELDLSSPTSPKKKQSESAPYKSGAYHKVIDSIYHDPWLSAAAVLVDGTKLSWTVTDIIRERKKTKRNARGKYKTKTKQDQDQVLEEVSSRRRAGASKEAVRPHRRGRRRADRGRKTQHRPDVA